MIEHLNRLIDEIESHLGDEIDVDAIAASTGTTGYHLRRMFSSLAGMPVSEYVRRRRMTVAASDVIGGEDFPVPLSAPGCVRRVRGGVVPVQPVATAPRPVDGRSSGTC